MEEKFVTQYMIYTLIHFIFFNYFICIYFKFEEGETQIGNDINNIEAVRFQLKTQFDRNVVTQFEVQEQILDYSFAHLSIDTDGSVEHPIFITEAIFNPNYSRIRKKHVIKLVLRISFKY